MFKNCVFKPSVNTVNWLKSAGVRAVKTFAQTMVGFVVAGAAMQDIGWSMALSVSCAATIASVLTSIAGIPEVKEER